LTVADLIPSVIYETTLCLLLLMQNACVECLEPFWKRVDYRNSTVQTTQLTDDEVVAAMGMSMAFQYLLTTLNRMHFPKNDIKIIFCRQLLAILTVVL